MSDNEQWFQVLGIGKPSKDQNDCFMQITEAINLIFESSSFDPSLEDPIVVNRDRLENLAQKLLEIREFKSKLAQQVTQLTQQAARGLVTEGSLPQLQAK